MYAIPVTKPTVSKDWRKHKALTPTNPFFSHHWTPKRVFAPFKQALQHQHVFLTVYLSIQLSQNQWRDFLKIRYSSEPPYDYIYPVRFLTYEQTDKFSLEGDQNTFLKTTNLSWTTLTFSSGPMWPIWLKFIGPEISLFRRNSALPHK